MEELKLNEHGVNIKIKANILPEKEMREIGFTDCLETTWYFSRMIEFPKEKRYRNLEISFSVSIKKNNPNDLRIDILDNDFCQPYDYQAGLKKNQNFEPYLIVEKQVEKWMEYLQLKCVLSGHIYGEYI